MASAGGCSTNSLRHLSNAHTTTRAAGFEFMIFFIFLLLSKLITVSSRVTRVGTNLAKLQQASFFVAELCRKEQKALTFCQYPQSCSGSESTPSSSFLGLGRSARQTCLISERPLLGAVHVCPLPLTSRGQRTHVRRAARAKLPRRMQCMGHLVASCRT